MAGAGAVSRWCSRANTRCSMRCSASCCCCCMAISWPITLSRVAAEATVAGLPPVVMTMVVEEKRAEALEDDDVLAASVRGVRGPPARRAGNGAKEQRHAHESGWLRQSTKNPKSPSWLSPENLFSHRKPSSQALLTLRCQHLTRSGGREGNQTSAPGALRTDVAGQADMRGGRLLERGLRGEP
jgi:hypothetical protein